MKIFSSLIAVIAVLLCCAGCKKTAATAAPPPEELRILSTVMAADHIIAELGCKEKIVAIDRHGKVLPSMEHAQAVVAGNSVSREVLKKHRINCAVVWYYQHDLIELLRRENIYTIAVGQITLAKYSDLVLELGRLCNRTDEAEKLNRNFRNLLENTAAAEQVRKVYFELYAPWKVPASTGYIGEIMQKAGGVFAAASEQGGTVSPEAVCTALPEVIFYVENFGNAHEIASRTALRNTPAVKNNRIYAVPRQLVSEGVSPEKLLKFLSDKLKDN